MSLRQSLSYEAQEDATVQYAIHKDSGKRALCGWLHKLGDRECVPTHDEDDRNRIPT